MISWGEDTQETIEEDLKYIGFKFSSNKEKNKFIEDYPEFLTRKFWDQFGNLLEEALEVYKANSNKQGIILEDKKQKSKLPIETYNPLFGDYKYPEANVIRERQQDISWTAQEITVSKDIHDYKHIMSPEALNLVKFTLQLFVEIEQKVGVVWETIASWFPHSEIEGCCSEISRMEKAVHAFFYQKMSDELNIDPEEIANNQKTIEVLKNKLKLLGNITSNLDENKALSLATVACIEQILLFSNFAMLKSFKANGNNLIVNTLTGVDLACNDEHLHGVFATYLHNTYIKEMLVLNPKFDIIEHNKNVVTLVEEIIRHEDEVVDYVFKDISNINNITADQLKIFIRSRANSILVDLQFKPIYEVNNNPIAEWFYKDINSIKIHDFFSSGTSSYRRGWKIDRLSRLPYLKGDISE